MAQTVTEELALIITAQTKEATQALNEYEENVKKATDSMSEAGTAADQTSQATSKGAEANKKATETEISKASAVDKSYNSYTKLIGAYAAVAIVVAKGIKLYKEFAAEGEVNVLAGAKLEAVYRATGKAAEFSFNQAERWASELRKATGIAEADTISMTASLSAFKNIGNEIMPQVIEHSANLSALWGENMTSSAKKLGRALEDPIKGMTQLEESGVVLDDESKNLIITFMEQGKIVEAQAILLNALEDRVGGLATSMHKALGPVGDFRAILAELKGDIGEDLLRLPDLQHEIEWLDKYLDARRGRRSLKDLFSASKDGDLQSLFAGMDAQEIEVQIDLVASSKPLDAGIFNLKDFDNTKQAILSALEQQLEVQRQVEASNEIALQRAKESAAIEADKANSITAHQQKTISLEELYKATEESRKNELEEQISLLKEQEQIDNELIKNKAFILAAGGEVTIAQLKEAEVRVGFYSAVIGAKQAELEGLTKIEIKEDYLGKLLGGVTASDYALDIPLSFDFGRTQKQQLEEQLSSLKGQINKLWSAGPAADDAGEWQTALDTLSDKYDSIGSAVATITEQDAAGIRAKELLLTLITEEQAALKKKVDYQQELEELESKGVITAEQRAELWNKEYGQVVKVKNAAAMTDKEFKKMGESLSKQLFNAESMGSTLSSMFSNLGSTLAEGGSGVDALTESAGQFVQQIMGQISQMALASGLRVLAETGIAGLPIALGLFALGGVAGIAGGLMGGSGSGLDDSLIGAMEDEVKARQNLADSINENIDTEYDLLRRQLDRNLISVDDFRAQAGVMQGERNFADAKAALSSAASGKVSGIDAELSDMSGWKKFWSGKDEDLEEQAAQIQALFDAISSVTDKDQLKGIKSQLEDLGVNTSDVPAFAKGGEFMTTGPQLIKVGDNPGGIEHVKITPVSSGGGMASGTGNQIININGNVYGIDDLYGKLQEAGVKLGRKKIS